MWSLGPKTDMFGWVCRLGRYVILDFFFGFLLANGGDEDDDDDEVSWSGVARKGTWNNKCTLAYVILYDRPG